MNFGSTGSLQCTTQRLNGKIINPVSHEIQSTCGSNGISLCWSQRQIILFFQASAGALQVITGVGLDVQESKWVEFSWQYICNHHRSYCRKKPALFAFFFYI